ncbi:MAG: alpha/beta fold hydrolase [Planctomycetota bacterium]
MRKSFMVLLITLLFSLCLSGCARQQEGQAVSWDEVAISYDVQGTGEPALVFVHGWSCDKSYWRLQVPYFAKRYKVVTIDLGGHGESGVGREVWSMEAFGKDVAAVVKELELEKVILVGHSMGGPVIIEAAGQMPERVIGLVGADTFLDLERKYTAEEVDAFLAPFKADFGERTSELVRGIFLADADPELVEWVVGDMCSARPAVGIGAMRELASFDAQEALKKVRKPIYCINSDMRLVNVEAGRRHAQSFEVKFMSGVGHFVMLEDAETFNRLLSETIEELSR